MENLLNEPDGSPRIIFRLALFFGFCCGLVLYFALRSSAGMANGAMQNGRATGGMSFKGFETAAGAARSENPVDLYLKPPNNFHRPKTTKPGPASAAPKGEPARAVVKSINRSKPLGSKSAGVPGRHPVNAALTQASKSVAGNQVSFLENDSALLRRGDQLKKGSQNSEALSAYRKVLAHSPTNEKALAGMGDLFLNSGRFDSAVQFYRSALAVNPRSPAVHNGLGTALYYNSMRASIPFFAKAQHIQDVKRYLQDQYDSAVAQYTAAISLDSGFVGALTNRGVLRDLHKDPEAALKDYSLSIKIKPANADAYSKRAGTYKDLGRFDQAISDYSAAIKLDSSTYENDPTIHYANAYFGRGLAFYKTGKLDQAIADFDSTLVLSPKHTLALISKGVALADKKQYDSAIAAYSLALSLLAPNEYEEDRLLAYLQRGNSRKALGQYDAAIPDYQKALESPSLAPKACWRLAECFCLKGDAAQAMIWLQKAKSLHSADLKKWGRDRELSSLWSLPEFEELIRN